MKLRSDLKTFYKFSGVLSISELGNNMSYFTLILFVSQVLYNDKPNLGIALSLISLFFVLPNILIAPLAGVYADRLSKRKIIITTDMLNFICSISLFILVLNGWVDLYSILVYQLFTSIFKAFHHAAFSSSQYTLLPKDYISKGNGFIQMSWSAARVLSPSISIFVIYLPHKLYSASLQTGYAFIFLLDGITFLLSILVISQIKIPQFNKKASKSRTVKKDIYEGILFFKSNKFLLNLLLSFTLFNLITPIFPVLIPVLLKAETSPLSFETKLTIINTLASFGGILGGILMTLWGGIKKKIYGVFLPMIIASAFIVTFGSTNIFYCFVISMVMINFMIPIMNTHSQSIWQINTPTEIQGRVFTVRRVVAQISWPLSTAIAGLIADGGISKPFLIISGLILMLYSFGQFFISGTGLKRKTTMDEGNTIN